MKKLLWVGLAVMIIVVALGIALYPRTGGQQPPSATPTATATTTPKNSGILTVEQVVALAKAGEFAKWDKIIVSGIISCSFTEGADWYVCLGPQKNEYLIVNVSVYTDTDFPEVLLRFPDVPSVETTVVGYYYGFRANMNLGGEEHSGYVIKDARRIK